MQQAGDLAAASGQALQEYGHDIKRETVALFLTVWLFDQLRGWEIASLKSLIAYVVSFLFTQRVFTWVVHFLYQMYQNPSSASVMFDSFKAIFRRKTVSKEVLTLGSEEGANDGEEAEAEEEEGEEEAKSEASEVLEEVEKVMMTWRGTIWKIIQEEVLPEAETADKTGKEVVILLAGEAIRMTLQLARFLLTSKWMLLGAVLAMAAGNFVPIHQSTSKWVQLGMWKAFKTITLQDTEMGMWQRLIFAAKDAAVGAQWGLQAHVFFNLLSKVVYGVWLEAHQKHNLPDTNIVQDTLGFGAKAGLAIANTAAFGATAGLMSLAQQRAQKKQQLALQNDWAQFQAQHPMIMQMAQQPAVTFPFPFSQAPPLPALEDESAGDRSRRLGRQKVVYGLRPKAKATKGRGAPTMPTDERTVIGSAAPLPFNDVSNDSFLIKPKPYEPVV
jgi:hypothetical protein